MANSYLKGVLGFKGDKGASAYEIAVKHGFRGTEQDWLATIGTTSNFSDDKVSYITTTTNETTFDLPTSYIGSEYSAIEVYVNGIKRLSDTYTVNDTTRKVILTSGLPVVGTKVEIVALTLTTNALPIVETINSSSTNQTAPGTKAVYDYVQGINNSLDGRIGQAESDILGLMGNIGTINNSLNSKVNTNNFRTLTGSIQNIAAGATSSIELSYPSGFTKTNTLIISKMSSTSSDYYDTFSTTDTTNGFPVITQIALLDDKIKIWMKNNSTSQARIGYYKVTIMRLS